MKVWKEKLVPNEILNTEPTSHESASNGCEVILLLDA